MKTGRAEEGMRLCPVTPPMSPPESESPFDTVNDPRFLSRPRSFNGMSLCLLETDLQEPAVEFGSYFHTLFSPSLLPQDTFLFEGGSQRSNCGRRMKLGCFLPALCLPGRFGSDHIPLQKGRFLVSCTHYSH